MKFTRKLIAVAFATAAMFGLAQQSAEAAGEMKPFVMASNGSGSVSATTAEVSAKLEAAGFQIAGTYSPYPTATILVVTNRKLKLAATKNDFGAYGVAQRVAITNVNGKIQVSFTNPVYMAGGYRMAADLSGVRADLAKALGDKGEYGLKKGLTDAQLRKYHYMFGMEYFDEPSVLAEYDSYRDAVAGVEAALANNNVGVAKVARINVPGKKESYFAVSMSGDKNSADKFRDDGYVMSEIDFKDQRSTAHLPYEIVVSGDKVYALYARFRIAVNFPDLSMMGNNSFMNIMDSPEAIRKALVVAAGGKPK